VVIKRGGWISGPGSFKILFVGFDEWSVQKKGGYTRGTACSHFGCCYPYKGKWRSTQTNNRGLCTLVAEWIEVGGGTVERFLLTVIEVFNQKIKLIVTNLSFYISTYSAFVFADSNSCISVNIQNETHVRIIFLSYVDRYCHLLHYWPFLLYHSVYLYDSDDDLMRSKLITCIKTRFTVFLIKWRCWTVFYCIETFLWLD
jgi:hypothetical protein